MDPIELSKKYADDADYFSNLLVASYLHIKPIHATKFEAIILACKNTSIAYAALAAATTESAIQLARSDVNKYAMEIDKARAAFASF
jgi:arginine/lysine/ornithine decarboxylase